MASFAYHPNIKVSGAPETVEVAYPGPLDAFGKGRLGMLWAPAFQAIHCDGLVFRNDSATATEPSHDLAHLLAGANGGMLWHPIGDNQQRRIAEYNAVFIENFLSKCYYAVKGHGQQPSTILPEVLDYMRWFTGVHYAPFPVMAEEAYRQFCWAISPPTMSRLSSLFFQLREVETNDKQARSKKIEIAFPRTFAPMAAGQVQQYAQLVGSLLAQVAR